MNAEVDTASVQRIPFVTSYVLSWLLIVTCMCLSIVLIHNQQKPVTDVTLVITSASRVNTKVIETLDVGAPIVFDTRVAVAALLQASVIVARDKLIAPALRITNGAQAGSIFVLDDIETGAGRWSETLNSGTVALTLNSTDVAPGALTVFSGSSGTVFQSVKDSSSPTISLQTGALLLSQSDERATMGFRDSSAGVSVDSSTRMNFSCTELGFLEQEYTTVADFVETFAASLQVSATPTAVSLVRLRARVTGSNLLNRVSGPIGVCTIKLVACGIQISGSGATHAALACSVQLQWTVEILATVGTSVGSAKIELGSQTTSAAYFVATARFQWVEDGDDVTLLYTFATTSNPPATFIGSIDLELAYAAGIKDPEFGVSLIPTFA
jgi:hypothetical protein